MSRWSRRKRENHPADERGRRHGSGPGQRRLKGRKASGLKGRTALPRIPSWLPIARLPRRSTWKAMTYDSDFTVFMKRGVPETLKNAALRKLWRSNPDLAVLDGLNDYDTDFRPPDETAMDGFKSAWKVGRGYADKAEEVAAEMESR
ncbi:DUF3306 domain-containing protein [uncultured Roseibium sp.]|uniref:DUF3306 domain-containing protein n=1 Tax=uncultured Roseibium sp. TaxID=1936171 RepID=UPI0032177FD5